MKRPRETDLIKWARKMANIGRYKEIELSRWYKSANLRERIVMTEELLNLEGDCPLPTLPLPDNFISLSRALE